MHGPKNKKEKYISFLLQHIKSTVHWLINIAVIPDQFSENLRSNTQE